MAIDRDYNAAVDFIDRHVAEGRGDKAVFVDPSRAVSYAELSSALARAGVIPMLLGMILTSDQYHYLPEDTRAQVAFFSASVPTSVQSAAEGVATLEHIVTVGKHPDRATSLDALLVARREPIAAAKTCADESAHWLYSSSTTGTPKAGMHVHSSPSFVSQLARPSRIEFHEDDVVFSAGKLFLAYGIGRSICTAGVGATSMQNRHLQGGGSTEMGHLFLTNLLDAVDRGCSRIPVPGYEMRLLDPSGYDVADGDIDEMLVRGRSSAAGYWSQRQRRVFKGQWTRTGDKYVRRPDGACIDCGRTDDMLNVSGIRVSPFEVEAAFTSHPDVIEAAVVPAEDDKGLVKPMAFVVFEKGAGESGGRALYEGPTIHLKRTIGPWKYPRRIEFVDALPKTATGMIQRFKLHELAASHASSTGADKP